jgi:opacity protein-like surface antigen
MKKIVKFIVLTAVMFAMSGTSFAKFGIALTGGYYGGTDNFDKLHSAIDVSLLDNGSSVKNSNSSIDFGVLVSYELVKVKIGKGYFGIQSGYISYGSSEININLSYTINQLNYEKINLKIEANAYAVPFTVYYKYSLSDKWKIYGGAGVSYVSVKYYETSSNEVRSGGSYSLKTYSGSELHTKIAGDIAAGAEWAITKRFSLLADVSYLFGAKIQAKDITFDGEKAYKDLSGISAGISAKLYLF